MLTSLTNRSTVALILIWALLLCHGAFGALHEFGDQGLLHPPDHGPAHALAAHAGGHETEGPGATSGDPVASTAYAAVLVILMLGAATPQILRTLAQPAPASPALAYVRAPELPPSRARTIAPASSGLPAVEVVPRTYRGTHRRTGKSVEKGASPEASRKARACRPPGGDGPGTGFLRRGRTRAERR